MRSVDTNVLVRYFVADDADQAQRARSVMAAGGVFVATTVLLETEWVLRQTYRLSRPVIVDFLRALTVLTGVTIEDTDRLTTALDWVDAGMDFADALHLA